MQVGKQVREVQEQVGEVQEKVGEVRERVGAVEEQVDLMKSMLEDFMVSTPNRLQGGRRGWEWHWSGFRA